MQTGPSIDLSAGNKIDKLAISLPYDSFTKFKDVVSKFKSKMDDYQIAKIFIRCNTILHMPELTRTDEFSVGKRNEHNETNINKAFTAKILDLVGNNIEEERQSIIAETF